MDARAECRSRSKRWPCNRGVVCPHAQVIVRPLRLRTADSSVTAALMGMHHVNRVEAPRQTVCPALLAADQCVHDLHAGELGKYHEPAPLDHRISYGSADRAPGCTSDFHAGGETLCASIWQCAGRWRPDDVGRCVLAHESLPYPLCRAHRDGCHFRSIGACGLLSLRRSRAAPSRGVGSRFRTAYPLTFRATCRQVTVAGRKATSAEIHEEPFSLHRMSQLTVSSARRLPTARRRPAPRAVDG